MGVKQAVNKVDRRLENAVEAVQQRSRLARMRDNDVTVDHRDTGVHPSHGSPGSRAHSSTHAYDVVAPTSLEVPWPCGSDTTPRNVTTQR